MTTKPTPQFNVFTLHDMKGNVKYVGLTKTSVDKRLQDMAAQAKLSTCSNYKTPVSNWLREMDAAFKMPGFAVAGSYPTRDEAKARQHALIIKHQATVLNVVGNSIPFKRIDLAE